MPIGCFAARSTPRRAIIEGGKQTKRLLWFAALWLASVVALGVIAALIKMAIPY
ncbi:DUF2474 family protein [Roseovarius lutimaris]|uniref:DUF2474 family protein n=1 Tax=Roseovarius lutimaris TaxID=1005928 RepID=UPI000B81A9F9|nr:DUF2474 family protein [Roseovarius lutimaris]